MRLLVTLGYKVALNVDDLRLSSRAAFDLIPGHDNGSQVHQAMQYELLVMRYSLGDGWIEFPPVKYVRGQDTKDKDNIQILFASPILKEGKIEA